MKIRTNIKREGRPFKEPSKEYEKDVDFYERWYAKFGEPRTHTMPADEFLARLKEMIDFE